MPDTFTSSGRLCLIGSLRRRGSRTCFLVHLINHSGLGCKLDDMAWKSSGCVHAVWAVCAHVRVWVPWVCAPVCVCAMWAPCVCMYARLSVCTENYVCSVWITCLSAHVYIRVRCVCEGTCSGGMCELCICVCMCMCTVWAEHVHLCACVCRVSSVCVCMFACMHTVNCVCSIWAVYMSARVCAHVSCVWGHICVCACVSVGCIYTCVWVCALCELSVWTSVYECPVWAVCV